ncbi:MAG: peptidyl-prolyl cis-trans isomerase A (cyclophilin A) [Pseudohongiellaceae bacterium]|jgi:peptidyl-prolyl cis-trans isomerase A (cyclophilin A)
MRHSQSLLCSLAVVSLLLTACSKTTEEDAKGSLGGAESATDDTAVLTAALAEADPEFVLDIELLKRPKDPAMNEQAPATFKVLFVTTKGDFVIEAHRDWAPNGADRFYNLSKSGFFDGIKLFRVVKGFMAQFGIHGDPAISKFWMNANIQDDPVTQKNTRGFITFANTGSPNSRATQLFINYGDNSRLDRQAFAPFGKVSLGMDVVDSLFAEYGERTTRTQGSIYQQGNAFLEANFPKLDWIVTARVIN